MGGEDGKPKAGLEPLTELGSTAPVDGSRPGRAATPFDGARPNIQWSPVVSASVGTSVSVSSSDPHAGSNPRAVSERVLSLVWCDTSVAPRLRLVPKWRSWLDDVPGDLELDGDDDRRDVFEILSRAHGINTEGLAMRLQEAVRGDGKLVAPLVVAEGTLRLAFEPLRRLAVTAAVVKPLAHGDDELTRYVESVKDYAERADPHTAADPQAATEALLTRMAQRDRAMRRDDLERKVERALLTKRAFDRRHVLGAELVTLVFGDRGFVPAYADDAMAAAWPLHRMFSARILAELHPRQDEEQRASCALRIRAVARVLSPNELSN